MGGQKSGIAESLDDILSVVKETERGRWFLDAYTNRLSGENTKSILNAIAKLESNLHAMPNAGTAEDTALLEKTRKSIAQARSDIAALTPNAGLLSTEAQLFAKLAEASRKAFTDGQTAEPSISNSVERALKLVAELDRELNVAPLAAPVAPPKPAVQYFKQDEDIFEPAPTTTFKAPKTNVAPIEMVNRGAKLVIKHIAPDTETAAPIAVEEEIPPSTEVPVLAITPPAAADTNAEPARIVIIRRKMDEVMEVPLLEEQAPEAESAA